MEGFATVENREIVAGNITHSNLLHVYVDFTYVACFCNRLHVFFRSEIFTS